MSSATAVRTTLPLPATIAAVPRGVAWIAHPTGARPARKTTSMLLTVTSPATPAWGARAPVTDKIVRTCTSAVAKSGPVTQVEQPDATTDGAAGGTRVTAGAGGPLELAVSWPLLHPARPTTATAATTLATRLIGLYLQPLSMALVVTVSRASRRIYGQEGKTVDCTVHERGAVVEQRDIEIFLTLAEELHFGRTAERLHVSWSCSAPTRST